MSITNFESNDNMESISEYERFLVESQIEDTVTEIIPQGEGIDLSVSMPVAMWEQGVVDDPRIKIELHFIVTYDGLLSRFDSAGDELIAAIEKHRFNKQ